MAKEAADMLAADGAQPAFKGPAKWTDDEIANGHIGIRWINRDGVAGRPTQHDVREYLLMRGADAMCGCDKCKPDDGAQSEPVDKTKISVSALALRELLYALNGPSHLLRELQALRGPLVGDTNPINILLKEYNSEMTGKLVAEMLAKGGAK